MGGKDGGAVSHSTGHSSELGSGRVVLLAVSLHGAVLASLHVREPFLLRYRRLPNGIPDQKSMHGGCPVLRGAKVRSLSSVPSWHSLFPAVVRSEPLYVVDTYRRISRKPKESKVQKEDDD